MSSAMTLFWKLHVFFMQLVVATFVVAGLSHLEVKAASDATAPPFASLFGGPFELVDQDGQPKSDKDFRGKFMLIYFGYVNCPAICPANLQQMAVALEQLGAAGKKIQPIFISLDPARDTPAKLKEFVANFGSDFIGLTGTEAQIKSVSKAYKAIRRKVTLPEQESEDDYLVFHSTLMLFMDTKGKFLTLFPHNTRGIEMAKRMRKYLKAQAPS